MQKNVFRKSLVLGIILLFLGIGVISNITASINNQIINEFKEFKKEAGNTLIANIRSNEVDSGNINSFFDKVMSTPDQLEPFNFIYRGRDNLMIQTACQQYDNGQEISYQEEFPGTAHVVTSAQKNGVPVMACPINLDKTGFTLKLYDHDGNTVNDAWTIYIAIYPQGLYETTDLMIQTACQQYDNGEEITYPEEFPGAARVVTCAQKYGVPVMASPIDHTKTGFTLKLYDHDGNTVNNAWTIYIAIYPELYETTDLMIQTACQQWDNGQEITYPKEFPGNAHAVTCAQKYGVPVMACPMNLDKTGFNLRLYDHDGNPVNDHWTFYIAIYPSLYQGENSPPNTPSTPSGPSTGYRDISYTYSTSATDPDGDQVYYWFDWGDGSNSGWVGPYNSGQTGSASHSWDDPGTYYVKAKAKDTYGDESNESSSKTVIIYNQAPNTPSKPSGPTSGDVEISYTYSSSTTDPDGDQVYYWFDWDDGSNSGWVGPYNSGQTGSASHSWDDPGTYYVQVKAKDSYNSQSGWSSYLQVNIGPGNQPPNPPSNPDPYNGETNVPIDTSLSCYVYDPDGDTMDVEFFWEDNELIDTVYNVGNGEVTIDPPGLLEPDTTYGWYVRVTDNINSPVTSNTWYFTTTGERAWTFLVYLDGDNNLENASMLKFNAMESVANNNDINIVALLDRTPGYNTTNGNWEGTRRFKVIYDTNPVNFASYTEGENMWDLGEQDMGDPNTLINFVNWGISHFPGNHYALIFFDHGRGFLRGDYIPLHIGYDDTNGSAMSVPQLGDALDTITSGGTNPLDVVFLDACLMQMMEVNFEIRNFASYLVANENLGLAALTTPGLYYDDFMDDTTSTTTPQFLAQLILTEYFDKIGAPLAASVTDLSTIDNLESEIDTFAAELNQLILNDPPSAQIVQDTLQAVQTLDSNGNCFTGNNALGIRFDQNDVYIDLYDFCDIIINNINDATVEAAAQDVMDALDLSTIIQFEHRSGSVWSGSYWGYYNLDSCHGISIYFPLNAIDPIYGDLEFSDVNSWPFLLQTYINLFPNQFPYTPIYQFPEDGATNVDINADLSWSGGDPNPDDTVIYDIYFGVESNPPYYNTTDPYPASTTNISYTMPLLEYNTKYFWRIVAKDNHGHNTSGDIWVFTTVGDENDPPNTPDKPSGSQFTKVGVSYTYLTRIIDPDGHQVYYMWDWGDGTYSDWIGPFDSGDMADASHTWNAFGVYQIKVMAKDDPNGDGDLSDGAESDWAPPLTIISIKNKAIQNLPFLNFLQSHPNLFPILQKMLQRLGL